MPSHLKTTRTLLLIALLLAFGIGVTTWAVCSPHSTSKPPQATKTSAHTPTLTVFAAASTTNVLTEIAKQYTKETGVLVRLNFASSSTLARQIEAGNHADLFLSANPKWMDFLDEVKLIQNDSRHDLLANRLVLIAPKGKKLAVEMRSDFDFPKAFEGRLALGDPDHVPAGIYARHALEHYGWFRPLSSRIIPCQNVRMALATVELGEAATGVVYATDAQISRKVDLIATFPDNTHPPIRYPVTLCTDATPAASEFLKHLTTSKASEVFRRHGFVPLIEKSP